MSTKTILCLALLGAGLCWSGYAAEEYTTSPADPAELEALYTAAIDRRATDILDALDLKDSAKAAEVHAVIVNQYRALRARDAVIDDYIRVVGDGPDASSSESVRAGLSEKLTQPLHEMYVKTLSALLTPEQVEIVKDQMTYNKVKVTFDAYCEIVPNLTEAEKTMILTVLKSAREEAIDGGSAQEKHAVFDRYKGRINAQLKQNGHDVDKAFKDWEAKQSLAAHAATNAPAASN